MSTEIKRYASEQYVNEAINEAIEIIDFPEVSGTSRKMDKDNPVGTGSLSLNRKANTIIGLDSVAIGSNTTAKGDYSHAEGYQTTTNGGRSHAEGFQSTTYGWNSHAEGNKTKTGDESDANLGESSHAEGNRTHAYGKFSHAEGSHTYAHANASHVQGRYNIKDTAGTYAHIVGNGTSEDKRSNAHTIDWSGEAWFQGDIYVGSTNGKNKDDGSKKVFTRGDYTYTTTDPGAGSPLAAGNFIFVYE